MSFTASKAFREGWAAFNRNAVTLVGFSVLAFLVIALLQTLQFLITSAVLSGSQAGPGPAVILIGLALLQTIFGLVVSIALLDGSLQAVRGERLSLLRLLRRSSEVPNLIGLQLFAVVAIALGGLAFVLPGVYLAVAYVFSGLALVDGPRCFVDALNLSRRLITPHWFDIALFLAAVAALAALGYLACLVGAFVSVPVAFCVAAAAYQQLLDLSGES
ncbi:MAG: hypothetical protein RLZZ611_1065 [Cyanobacteriota bacterium]|jgi:hypothetical protein